ncbi:protein of unknown function (plasmid) [Agreia sp. COWG]|nr:protein of unknown function [Agreia sp. COWG]
MKIGPGIPSYCVDVFGTPAQPGWSGQFCAACAGAETTMQLTIRDAAAAIDTRAFRIFIIPLRPVGCPPTAMQRCPRSHPWAISAKHSRGQIFT